MKRYYKLLTVFMTVVVLLYLIFGSTQVVYASGGGSFSDDAFRYNSELFAYDMVDSSSIPEGKHFFYKYDEGKAWYTTYANGISLLANKAFGLSVSTSILSALVSGFDSYAENKNSSSINFSAVIKGGVPAGWTFNSLAGCKLVNPNGASDEATISSDTSNVVYDYVKDYIDNNYSVPDFINYVPITVPEIKNLINASVSSYVNKINVLEANTDKYIAYGTYQISSQKYDVAITDYLAAGIYEASSDSIFYASDLNSYNKCCQLFALTGSDNKFTYTDCITAVVNSTQFFAFYARDGQGNTTCPRTYYNSTYDTPTNTTGYTIRAYNLTTGDRYFMIYSKPITIYKDTTVVTQILNNTYAPQYNTTNTYKNYDSTSSENNVTFNTQTVDNSQQNNSTIYNEQSENYTDNSYYNSENNYYIDQSQVSENNTTIINNYYGDGGSGGGGSDDDDDDDAIWKALLKAIADFFKKIGEFIATVLTGIVTILTSILDAIATIVSDFSGITDFLGQIFAWLPSEIITLMTLGLSTALFAAFLTWFKK